MAGGDAACRSPAACCSSPTTGAFSTRVATRIIELDRGQLSSYRGQLQRLSAGEGGGARDRSGARAASSTRCSRRRKSGSARASRRAARATKAGCGAWRRLRLERAARRERVGKVALARRRGRALGQAGGRTAQDVGKRFGDKPVVQDFSCRILRGDKVGLIGPNGSGKTTLLKLILGEIAAGRGQGAPRHQARRRLFRPVPRRARRGGDARRHHQPGRRFRRDRRRAQARDQLSRRFPVSAGARARAGQVALRRRAQPPAAGAPVQPAGQRAGAGRADQRSRHRDAGTAGRLCCRTMPARCSW